MPGDALEDLAVNRPDVVDEIYGGEAVLVNLRSGAYYALDPLLRVGRGAVLRFPTRLASPQELGYNSDPRPVGLLVRTIEARAR